MNGYKSTPRAYVPAWLRVLAEEETAKAARATRLQTPAIRWWKSTGGRWGGWTVNKGEINLVVDRLTDRKKVICACWEETRHCWQFATTNYIDDIVKAHEDVDKFLYSHLGFTDNKRLQPWQYKYLDVERIEP